MEIVTIARRYRGPLDSANGGYAAGLLGARLGAAAEVTLRLPPPLERRLVVRPTDVGLALEFEGAVVAEARPAEPALDVPSAPSPTEAAAAAEGVGGWGPPEFAACFVCGTRADESGLGIHPGRVPGRDGEVLAHARQVWIAPRPA
jgi:hypothetical protein